MLCRGLRWRRVEAFGKFEGELIDVEPRDQRVLACQELLERFASRAASKLESMSRRSDPYSTNAVGPPR